MSEPLVILLFWATRAEALHLFGDHERELAVVREGMTRHPELRVLVSYELRALAALGRTGELEAAMRSLAADAPAMMRQVAQELAAHGRADVARVVLRRTRAWYEASPESERASLDYQVGYARTLFLSDDRAAARKAFESLLRAYPRCLDCIGSIGVLAARDHHTATADSTVARLATSTRPFLFGRHLLWSARIAGARGDRELARGPSQLGVRGRVGVRHPDAHRSRSLRDQSGLGVRCDT